jgi:hypothetical protein
VDQRPARPVCSSVAEPRPRRRSLARKPELRDSGRRARRQAGWGPGFSFQGEARASHLLSTTGVGGGAAGSASSMATEVREPLPAPSSICAGNQPPVVDGQAEGADLQRVRQLVATDDEEAAGFAAVEAAAPAASSGYAAVWGRRRLGFPTLTTAFYMPSAGLPGVRAKDGSSDRAGLLASWARRPHRSVGLPCAKGHWARRRRTGCQATSSPGARTGEMGQAAELAGPVGMRLCLLGPSIYFLSLLFISFRNFQQFIFRSIDISLC